MFLIHFVKHISNSIMNILYDKIILKYYYENKLLH